MHAISSILFIYFILWWLVFMMFLSHGHELVENPEKGHATGAPKNPRIGKKILMASVTNAVLTAIIVLICTILDISL